MDFIFYFKCIPFYTFFILWYIILSPLSQMTNLLVWLRNKKKSDNDFFMIPLWIYNFCISVFYFLLPKSLSAPKAARTLKRIFVDLFIQGIYHNSFLSLLHHHFFSFFLLQISSWKFLSSYEYTERSPIWRNTSISNNNNKHRVVIQFSFPILPYSSPSLYSKTSPKVAYIYYLQFLML